MRNVPGLFRVLKFRLAYRNVLVRGILVAWEAISDFRL